MSSTPLTVMYQLDGSVASVVFMNSVVVRIVADIVAINKIDSIFFLLSIFIPLFGSFMRACQRLLKIF